MSVEKDEAKAVVLQDFQHGTTEDLVNDVAVRRKLDLWIMPAISCITYALQSIDKTTLSYAAVFGLEESTGLKGPEYGWLGSIFYLGYLIWEWPTSVLLQKLPAAKLLASTVFIWGGILTCHAAAHNFAGLAAARFFLGVAESAIQPCTMIIFSLFYKRQEQPLRMGIWIGCAGLGYVMAGITSFGIGHINGSLPSWRYTFIIWGTITLVWGLVVLFVLPDNPNNARFLNQDEKRAVIHRVTENETGLEDRHWKKMQFFETLSDIKTWLLFLFAVASNAPNGGLTTFQGLIIKGLGFSTLHTTLIQMPSGGVQFVVCVGATYITSWFTNARFATMLACLLPFLAGTVGTWLLPQSNPYGRLVCLWISFSYTATWTLSMSVVTANTAGQTKKSTTAAILLIGYCLGNFIGPFFFLDSQAPTYELGVGMMLCCVALQVVAIVGIWVLLWHRNTQRAKLPPGDPQDVYVRSLNDETDLQNIRFKYVY